MHHQSGDAFGVAYRTTKSDRAAEVLHVERISFEPDLLGELFDRLHLDLRTYPDAEIASRVRRALAGLAISLAGQGLFGPETSIVWFVLCDERI